MVISPEAVTEPAQGLFGRPVRAIRRNKLACFVSALLAVLFVSLIALFAFWLVSAVSMVTDGRADADLSALVSPAFSGGVMLAFMACLFNFYAIPVSVPLTWFLISQSVGRLAHRSVSDKWIYMRWSAFWGALLVGVTCAVPGLLVAPPQLSEENAADARSDAIAFFLGSVITGGGIGTLAGILVGLMFVAIVRPSEQLGDSKTQTLAVF